MKRIQFSDGSFAEVPEFPPSALCVGGPLHDSVLPVGLETIIAGNISVNYFDGTTHTYELSGEELIWRGAVQCPAGKGSINDAPIVPDLRTPHNRRRDTH